MALYDQVRAKIVTADEDGLLELAGKLSLTALNDVDEHGWTLLHHAVNMRLVDTCAALVGLGARIDANTTIDFVFALSGTIPAKMCLVGGRTPLHIAAAEGDESMFKLLCSLNDSGALQLFRDNDGRTAMDLLFRHQTHPASQNFAEDLAGVTSRLRRLSAP
eukprot:ANDGO_02731.mRNA.1 ankyrin repeat-containing protein